MELCEEEKKAIEWLENANFFSARLYAPIILNLIEKLKEQNEYLKDKVDKQQKVIQELKEFKKSKYLYNLKLRDIEIATDNSWKDKIREKIKAFQNIKKEIIKNDNELLRSSITYDIIRNDYCEKMLQELLEEE